MNLNGILKKFPSVRVSKREYYLFYGVVILVICFCMERFVFYNIFSQLNLLDRKVAMLSVNYRKAKTLVANKEIIMKAATVYKDYLESPLSAQQNPLSNILSHIESLARKNGGILIDMKPGKGVVKISTHKVYTIEIGLLGSLVQVTNFIADLQKDDILMEIDMATFTLKEELLQLEARLSVIVF